MESESAVPGASGASQFRGRPAEARDRQHPCDWLVLDGGNGIVAFQKTYPSQLESILERALKGVDVVTVNRGLPGKVAESTADRLQDDSSDVPGAKNGDDLGDASWFVDDPQRLGSPRRGSRPANSHSRPLLGRMITVRVSCSA